MAQTERKTSAPAEQPFHMGDRIRKAREHVGMDRQTFAESIGIHRDTLAKYEETGRAKKSALISIAWNTQVRLEWLEYGALPWLNDENAPTPKGEGSSLPGHDSNVEPAGFMPSNVIHADFGAPDRPVTPRPVVAIGGAR